MMFSLIGYRFLQLLNVSTNDILIQSTGVIGQRIKKVQCCHNQTMVE